MYCELKLHPKRTQSSTERITRTVTDFDSPLHCNKSAILKAHTIGAEKELWLYAILKNMKAPE